MKRLATIRGCVAISLTLGIVLALASSADANSGQLGVFTRRGLSLERAHAALAAQSQIETAKLPTKLEEGLGASFAGVWFEPSTAKFCIGVVSSASRRAAERVVAQAGLASVVSYVSVRSTWAQLISAQGEWNGKLAHLARQQVSTGLTPSQNAVSVTISSSVPEHERALLERQAAVSHVNVSITVVPPEALNAVLQNSQCEIKPRGAYAFCSKPIAAGVLITPTEKREGYCTAGPLAILPNPTTFAAELETFLITAGHCTKEGEKWFTATHPGNELKEIGPTVKPFLFGLSGDYGAIEVNANWLEAGATPALAQMTHYEDNGLREAQNVLGEAASVQNLSFCRQGATSAEQCGIITKVNVLANFLVKEPDELQDIDGLVETNACGERGDSGGPVATLPNSNGVDILGTLVGGGGSACSGLFCTGTCITYYEPIKTSLTGLGLELLTTANQKRHRPPETLPFRSPAVVVCKEAPAGYVGLYTGSTCATNAINGTWAWATAGNEGKTTWYCLLSSSANRLYTEGLCQTHSSNSTGKFLAVAVTQAFPKLSATLDASILKGTVTAEKLEVSCKGGSLEGVSETASLAGQLTILYTGCTVAKPATCEVGSGGKIGELKTDPLMGTLASASLFSVAAESGAALLALEFKNKGGETCALNGEKGEVTGTQMCTFAAGIETPATEHDLTCGAGESSLKLAGSTASLESLVLSRFAGTPTWKIR